MDAIGLPDVTQTSVNINWAAVSGVVDDYQVEVSSTDFAQGATLLCRYPLTLTASSLVIGIDAGTNQLDPGTNYWIRIRSRNATGESPNSNSETFLTKPATPVLNAPDVSDIGQTTALISWSQVSGIVDNYLVDVSQDGFQTFISGFNAANISDTEVEVTGLDPGTVTPEEEPMWMRERGLTELNWEKVTGSMPNNRLRDFGASSLFHR